MRQSGSLGLVCWEHLRLDGLDFEIVAVLLVLERRDQAELFNPPRVVSGFRGGQHDVKLFLSQQLLKLLSRLILLPNVQFLALEHRTTRFALRTSSMVVEGMCPVF